MLAVITDMQRDVRPKSQPQQRVCPPFALPTAAHLNLIDGTRRVSGLWDVDPLLGKQINKSKIHKASERMVQGKQQPKFERDPCIRFRDNCDKDARTTDDGWTDERCKMDKFRFHELFGHSQADLKVLKFEFSKVLKSQT